MIIAYFLLGVAAIFMFGVFQGLRDLDFVEANTIYYVNITNPLPQLPNNTLTNSIRKRINEYYGSQESYFDLTVTDNTSISNPKVNSFYRKFMKYHVTKLSKIFLTSERDLTLKLFSVNSEWDGYGPHTVLNLFALKEERFYHINPRNPATKTWKHCLYQGFSGFIEAMAYSPQYDLLVSEVHIPQKDSRFLLYMDDLECDYSDAVSPYEFRGMYCEGHFSNFCYESSHEREDHIIRRIKISNHSAEGDDELTEDSSDELSLYDRILIEEGSKILNLAITKDLIVYNTIQDKFKLKCLFKIGDSWQKKVLEYPLISHKFRIHQTLGMDFIIDSTKGEKQLLIVDLIGNENNLFIVYFVYRFVTGTSLLKDETLMKPYGVESIEEIEPEKFYGSVMFELIKIDVSEELTTIDGLRSMPKSIIKSQHGVNQTIVVSLEKYILLIKTEEENDLFSMYPIKHFEDQGHNIKSFDISADGNYLAFLTYLRDKQKVFIVHSKTAGEIHEDKLYLVNFDYSVNVEQGIIKDVKLLKSIENETILMVLMESGEVVTFALHFGAMGLVGLSGTAIEDEVNLFSLFSLLLIVFMFIFVKIANSTRIHINLRRPR